jgi:hypothetical protein
MLNKFSVQGSADVILRTRTVIRRIDDKPGRRNLTVNSFSRYR